MPREEGWGSRWALRSVGFWMLFGASVWAIGLNWFLDVWIDEHCGSASSVGEICEPFPAFFAQHYAVFVGAAWGLVAGTIGSLVGVLSRARLGYGITMFVMAAGLLAPLAAISVGASLIAVGLGVAAFFSAVRWIAPSQQSAGDGI